MCGGIKPFEKSSFLNCFFEENILLNFLYLISTFVCIKDTFLLLNTFIILLSTFSLLYLSSECKIPIMSPLEFLNPLFKAS